MQAAGLGARRPAAAPTYKAPAFLDAYARRHGKQARAGGHPIGGDAHVLLTFPDACVCHHP